MAILVLLETESQQIKRTSLECIAYAIQAATPDETIVGLGVHQADPLSLQQAGKVGLDKVYFTSPDSQPTTADLASIEQLAQKYPLRLIIAPRSTKNDTLIANCAAHLQVSVISGVTSLPTLVEEGFEIEKSVFSGKASMRVYSVSPTTCLLLRKNIIEYTVTDHTAEIVPLPVAATPMNTPYQVVRTETTSTDISLADAAIIVSGGKGMQGPDHWQPLLDLAKALGAATGCSKPVADLHWRPHHEHIGQTGLKVAPDLYIACGISGAIQHLAGVNKSKCIVVINKDPEAPFFKEADYGIIGDLFEVVPRLTKALLETK